MDGSARKVIVDTNNGFPTGLAIDFELVFSMFSLKKSPTTTKYVTVHARFSGRMH